MDCIGQNAKEKVASTRSAVSKAELRRARDSTSTAHRWIAERVIHEQQTDKHCLARYLNSTYFDYRPRTTETRKACCEWEHPDTGGVRIRCAVQLPCHDLSPRLLRIAPDFTIIPAFGELFLSDVDRIHGCTT